MAGDSHLDLNRSWWDERVPIHVGSAFYDVDGFRAGGSTLRPFEVEEVGDVTGKRLAHLQCHFGLDTLSWARAGATVAGLDFSGPAIEAATSIARETGIDAKFVQADVYEAVEALGGEPFDIVYTGFGAINWLPDLHRWASIVASLLAEGGFLYLAEFHPFTWVFDEDTETIAFDYFHDPEGVSFGDEAAGSYADMDVPTRQNRTLEWAHPLSEVFDAVLGAGMRIELFSEQDYTLFPRFETLELDREFLSAGVVYRQPADKPRLPLIYSLRARRDPVA